MGMEAKNLIRRLLRNCGWEVQRLANANIEQQVLKDIVNLTGISVALDVGANVGQLGDLLLESGFKGGLLSFEAIPSVHSVLVAHAKSRRRSVASGPVRGFGKQAATD